MSIPTRFPGAVSFGEFELDLRTAELRTNGNKVVLPGQPFQILVTLLSRPGELVTRKELQRELWPSHTFVDFDVSLNKAVNRLREALGDSAQHPRFIETLPRKGYRFIGAVGNGVDVGTANASAVTDELQPASPSSHEKIGAVAQWLRSRVSGLPYVLSAAIAFLFFVVIVPSMLFVRRGAPNLTNVHITKLTDSGRATGVAISTDGRYVVYSLRLGEDESLRLRQISTGSDVEILPIGPAFHGLTFSPNSDYVYFVRSDPNQPYFKYLYSVPLLGGPVRRMIADVDSPVTFSPDGKQFAFQRAVPRRNVIELRIANADGSAEQVIATIQNGDAGLFQPGPSWSRDGRTIVCPFRILGKEIRWVLTSVSVPAGTVREIYSDTAPFGRPVWFNGHSLLVPRYDAAYERWQLWTVSYPDGNARRFTNDLTDYDAPLDVAGDGKTVAAVASTIVSNIWEAPADNLSRAIQVTFGQLPLLNVTETTAGRLLSSDGNGRVWLVKPDGQREAFSDLHDVGWIRTCSDLILFTSFEASAVTLTRLIGDNSRVLQLFSGDLAYPGCSPDGKFAYYVNRHRPQKIWRISTDGGSSVEIGDGLGDGINGWLDVSPDGALLSFTFSRHDPPAWKLAVMPAGGGPAIHTFDIPGGAARARWAPGGTGLQYLVTEDGATNIWEQPLVGGRPKRLTNFTSDIIFDFNWSSDRRRLLLTRGDVTSDVVLLTNIR
jgi:DNA-binding winged helix-turn-helix (wHTH) protein/dipeptidyl aminopeptidase/acylaminoacyl peptidase